MGGRPPYGYRLADAGPHPNPAKATDGKRAHRLEPDPVTAPIVARIFAEYLEGAGLKAIAEGLTRDGVPSPSAHDPARNRHRNGAAWNKRTIQTILANPRYTGREVWGRQPRHERLVSIDDVALGYATSQQWADPADWVWSAEPAHEALVDIDTFAAASSNLVAGRNRPATRSPRRSPRPYVLRGLVFCGVCGRRMEGAWNHDEAHYRCRYPKEFQDANGIDHPRTVYLREAAVLPTLDRWLAGLFAPENLDATIEALLAAPDANETTAARIDAAQRVIDDCTTRLARYRAAIEEGVDPKIVAVWIADVEGERLAAEQVLADYDVQTPDENALRAMIEQIDVAEMLAHADATDKAALYADLGITLTYKPSERAVLAEARPVYVARVGGGT